MKRKYIEKRMLNVPLTEAERLTYGEELARAQQARDEAETHKKVATSQLGNDVKAKTAEVQRLAGIVNGKSKTQEVECHWVLNLPKKGQKSLVRQDTKVVIETRDMDQNDQAELFPNEVADLEKPPGEGGEAPPVRDVTPRLGLRETATEGDGKKPAKKAGKKKDKGGEVDWPAVKAFYLEKRSKPETKKTALAATALRFGISTNTIKARVRREKWNEEAGE